jgi:hypothetical protein
VRSTRDDNAQEDVIAGLPNPAESAPSPARDAEILNLALLLEHMELDFFTEASVSGRLTGELLEFADIVRGHERAHVGSFPAASPTGASGCGTKTSSSSAD